MALLFPAVAAIAGALTFGLHRAWDNWVGPKPILVCPSAVDLGARDRGQEAIARFAIQNTGNRELIVDQFTTSCSCAGVERTVEGKPVRVESVRVSPGATAELFVRVMVNVPVGGNQWIQIFFHSNDPNRSIAQLDVTVPLVTGGICASPQSIIFGSLPIGKPAQRVVDLYDAGGLGRRVARARSLQPERFAVRVLPLTEGEGGAAEGAERTLIARLEVTARTEQSGQLDGEIEVEVVDENRPPCRISVTGEVASTVQCWPRAIVLPRRVGGQTVFSGEVLVRGEADVPLDVRLLSAPAGLRVDIREVAGQQDQRIAYVEGKPDPAQPLRESAVRLQVRSGASGQEVLTIPVRVAELAP